jgi:hypothetical protein
MIYYVLSYQEGPHASNRSGQRFTVRRNLFKKIRMLKERPDYYSNIKVEAVHVWSEHDMEQELLVDSYRAEAGWA